MMWYVYILLCEGDTLYTGISTDVEARFKKHQEGKGGKYTKSHRPIKIVYQEECENRSNASRREYEVKKMIRLQKEGLIKKKHKL